MNAAAEHSLKIVYRDEDCIAVNKPPGLLVHRTSLDSKATEFALQMLRDQIGRRIYPVHRLDRPTSGLLLFGLSSAAASALVQQFAAHSVCKTYTVFVRGWTDDAGVIDRPLRDPIDARSTRRTSGKQRSAVTEFTTKVRYELPFSDGRHETSRYSLIIARPRTGRRHQIRRHLARQAHPILGDTTHGDHRHNKRMATRFQVARMLLAATAMSFRQPVTDEPLHLKTSPGPDFENLLGRIASFRKPTQPD